MHLASRIAHLRLENEHNPNNRNRNRSPSARSRSHSPVFRPPTDSDTSGGMVQPRSSTRSTVRRRNGGPAPQWQRVLCRMTVAAFGISVALYVSNLESEAIGKATETSVERHHVHDHEEFVSDGVPNNQAPGVSGSDAIEAGGFQSQKKELYQKPGTGTEDDLAGKRQEMLDKLRERKGLRHEHPNMHDHSIHGVNQPPEIGVMLDGFEKKDDHAASGGPGSIDSADESNPAFGGGDEYEDGATQSRDEDEDGGDEDGDGSATPASADVDDEGPDSDEDGDEDGEDDSPDGTVDGESPPSPSEDRKPPSGDDADATDGDGDESKDDEDDADDDVVHTEASPSKKDVDDEDEDADDDEDDGEEEGKKKVSDEGSDDGDAAPVKPKVKVRLDREEDAGPKTGDLIDTEASPSKRDIDGSEDDDEDSDGKASDGEEEEKDSDGRDSDDEDGDEDGDEAVEEQGPPVTFSSGDGDDGGDDDEKDKVKKKSDDVNDDDDDDDVDDADDASGSGDADADDDDDDEDAKKPKVRKIALLGERNTGTRWMSAQLEGCFPSIRVSPRLLRWKHWFQDDDGSKHDATLVISQFRNVYEWTEAMRVVPHHAPLHVKLEWRDFVTKPWTMERPKRDLPFKDSKEQVCFEKFKYNQLISCIEGSRNDTSYLDYNCDPDRHYSCHKPIYELKQDGSGEPYENILDMRADKIRNFVLDIKKWKWIADVIPVQYETLLSNGTDFLISRVEEITGVKRKCKAVGAQVRKKRMLDPEMIQWLNDHVDWEAEALVEYKKWDKTGSAENNDEIDKGEGEGVSLATEMSESADENEEGGKKSAKLTDEGEDADGKKLDGDAKGEDVKGVGNGGDSLATKVSASADEKDEGEVGNNNPDVKDKDVSEEKVASKKRKYT